MKPKATTAQERMGFLDPDLTTPRHDEIILWLVANIETVVSSLSLQPIPPPTIDFSWLSLYSRPEALKREAIARFELEKAAHQNPIIEVTLEVPIMSRSYVIGFADALISIDRPVFKVWQTDERGTWDACWESWRHLRLYVEVKPTIPSLGELLRQVNHYKQYVSMGPYGRVDDVKMFVCSPDVRFKKPIEQQGVGFIVVPEGI